jgi:hypothetical protein
VNAFPQLVSPMKLQKIATIGVGILLIAAGWRAYGWAGAALAVTGLVMWLLMHFNRAMQVLKRAADRPLGYVDSAVMLNARLKPRSTLLHVVAQTRALGQPLSPENEQPEIFRWTDGGGSSVTCEFAAGKLVKWQLDRPEAAEEGAPSGAP